LTTVGFFDPTPVYSVALFDLLFADHHGDAALELSPHPFTNDASPRGALGAASETSG
jgi:hypothetical protein